MTGNFEYNLEVSSFNFIFGLIVLIIGVLINISADNTLLKLKEKKNEYQIPKGFLYNYISCPNYLGEIIEWLGFAIMASSIPAFLFFLWTIFNLLPRAISHHKWYKNNFENYPNKRKAIIPFLI